MQPKFEAMYRALVTSNTDPTNKGLVRLQCPQIGGTVEIRAAEPMNPQEPIPPVGSTVWVGFSGGDITKPFYQTNQAVPATVTTSTFPPNPFLGNLAYTTDTQALQLWDGSNWQDVYSPWYPYTPTWSGLTALGTGFVSQGYFQIMDRSILAMGMLIGGTGTSLGTNNITVSLPFTASSVPNANFGWTGAGRLNPSGGAAWHPLWPWISQGASTLSLFALRSTDLGWVSPGTASLSWVAGAVMNFTITYQI